MTQSEGAELQSVGELQSKLAPNSSSSVTETKLKMKLLLASVLLAVALHNGTGAPATARYKYVRCNPDGEQANCVTYQSAQFPLSPDHPSKLPASAADVLDANAVEGESPKEEKLLEDGSGVYEGSGSLSEVNFAFTTFEPETGSGGKPEFRELEMPEEKELEEDYLLQP